MTSGEPQGHGFLRRHRRDLLIAAGIVAATMVFGAFHTGRHPFWLDEAFSASSALQSWSQLVSQLHHEAGGAPYAVTLWAWARLGHSEWWLRLWSVTGGALALAACYAFVLRHIHRQRLLAISLVTALFCNQFFLYNLTELRTYSWVMLLAVVSTMLFVRLLARPTYALAAGYGASIGLLLGSLVFSIGLLAAHMLFAWPLVRDRTGRRCLALAGLTAAALFAPFVPALLTSNQLNWIPPLTMKKFVVDMCIAVGGYRWATVLAVGNVLLLLTFVIPSRRRPNDTALKVAVAGVFTMPLTLALMSLQQSYFLARYLAPMTPLAVLGAAAGFLRLAQAIPSTRVFKPAAIAVVGVVTVIAMLPAVEFDRARPEDMRSPAEVLTRYVHPGDAVVFNAEQVEFSAEYYWQPNGTVFLQDVPGRTYDPATETGFCHVWYYFRGTRPEILAMLGTTDDDPNVSVETFAGYVVAEVDACPG